MVFVPSVAPAAFIQMGLKSLEGDVVRRLLTGPRSLLSAGVINLH